jgi:hypothetical protein
MGRPRHDREAPLRNDEALASAFMELESDIHDLRRMAVIAWDLVTENEDTREEEKYFAVTHLREMIEALERGWEANLSAAKT